jgi:tryptophan synthase
VGGCVGGWGRWSWRLISLKTPRPSQAALRNNVTYEDCLEFVREARRQGLRAPVLLMGYYNPLLSHGEGEEQAVRDAKIAGANGFIVVDLPPEEAIRFRGVCTGEG